MRIYFLRSNRLDPVPSALSFTISLLVFILSSIAPIGRGNAQHTSVLRISDVQPFLYQATQFLVNGKWYVACNQPYDERLKMTLGDAACNGGADVEYLTVFRNKVINIINCTSNYLADCRADKIVESNECGMADTALYIKCHATSTAVFPWLTTKWSTTPHPDSDGGGSSTGWFGTSLYIPIGIIISIIVAVVCCGINLSRRRAMLQQAAGNRSHRGAPPAVLYVPPPTGAPNTAYLAYPRQPDVSAMSPPSYDDVARLPASPPPPPPASSQGVPPPPSYESVVIREEDK